MGSMRLTCGLAIMTQAIWHAQWRTSLLGQCLWVLAVSVHPFIGMVASGVLTLGAKWLGALRLRAETCQNLDGFHAGGRVFCKLLAQVLQEAARGLRNASMRRC